MPSLDEIEFTKPPTGLTLDKAIKAGVPTATMPEPSTYEKWGRTALQVGVPIAAAAATMPFTGGMSLPLVFGAEALASLGAEGALQATGVSERDNTQLGLAATLPAVGRGVMSGLAQIPRMIPGFGQAARAALTPYARALPDKLLPGPSSKALYAQVAQGNTKAVLPDFPQLQAAVKELGDDVSTVPWDKLQSDLKGTGLETLFGQIQQSLSGTPAKFAKQAPTVGGKVAGRPTGLPAQTVQTSQAKPPGLAFEEAQAAIEGFGKMIGRTTDPALRGNYKKLYSSLLGDLETAKAPADVPIGLWNQARTAWKREKASFLLQGKIEQATTTKEGVDVFNPDAVVKWLRTSSDFKDRVTAQEYRQVIDEFRNMSKLEGHNMSRFMGLLAGASMGGVGGALTGYIAAEQLSKALMTETGRKVVQRMIKNPNASSWRRLGTLLGTGAATAFDEPAKGAAPFDKFNMSTTLQPAPNQY